MSISTLCMCCSCRVYIHNIPQLDATPSMTAVWHILWSMTVDKIKIKMNWWTCSLVRDVCVYTQILDTLVDWPCLQNISWILHFVFLEMLTDNSFATDCTVFHILSPLNIRSCTFTLYLQPRWHLQHVYSTNWSRRYWYAMSSDPQSVAVHRWWTYVAFLSHFHPRCRVS